MPPTRLPTALPTGLGRMSRPPASLDKAGGRPMVGLTGFADAAYYNGAALAGPIGDATNGSTFAFLYRVDALAGATLKNVGGLWGANSGWSFYQNVGSDTARYDAGNGIDPQPDAFAAGSVGKVFLEVLVVAAGGGSGQIYRNGAASGAANAGTMAAADGTAAMYIGRRSAAVSNAATNVTIIGAAAANSTPLSAGQVAAWYTSCVIARDIVAPPAGGTHLWTARDAASAWVDRIGGVSLTRTGTLTTVSFVPTWG